MYVLLYINEITYLVMYVELTTLFTFMATSEPQNKLINEKGQHMYDSALLTVPQMVMHTDIHVYIKLLINLFSFSSEHCMIIVWLT